MIYSVFYCRKIKKRELRILNFKLKEFFVFLIFCNCQYFVQNTRTYNFLVRDEDVISKKKLFMTNVQ